MFLEYQVAEIVGLAERYKLAKNPGSQVIASILFLIAHCMENNLLHILTKMITAGLHEASQEENDVKN